MRTPVQPKIKDTAPRQEDTCAVPCFNAELVAAVQAALPDAADLKQAAALFNALADPTRLKILLALTHGELCVCDISHAVGLSVSATSHQLRLLRNLDLLRFRNDGKMAYYSVPDDSRVLTWVRLILPE